MGYIKAFMKKYAALLPPIGMVIFALLLMPPTLWLGGQVKARMSTSASQAQTIRSLSGDVPSADKPLRIEAYMDRLESEVKQIDALIEQSSKRELIAYNIFPKPQDTSSQVFVEYGRNYLRSIDDRLQSLNALDAPSEAEIRARTGAAAEAQQPGARVMITRERRPLAQDPMVNAMCIARAESIPVYINPSAFAWYEFWQNFEFTGTDSALTDCWNSQIAFWIYDDIIRTVQAMNAGSEKVSDSPVKRLLGIRFTGPVEIDDARQGGGMYRDMIGRGGRQTTGGRDIPNYVTDTQPSVFVEIPWTGRVGGEEHDVVHFAVSVIIDNRYVLDFMRELSSEKEHTFRENFDRNGRVIQSRHNQISILQNAVHAVDKDSPAHELYRYGGGAVMRLDLVCEYLLSREGYDTIKPEPVKKQLGQQDQAETSPSPGGLPGRGIPGM